VEEYVSSKVPTSGRERPAKIMRSGGVNHAMEPVNRYRTSATQQAAMKDIGYAGLNISGGLLSEEFHPDLRGRNAIRIYKEMRDNDPIVGAMLFAVSMMMRQARWNVRPFDVSSQAQEQADMVKSCMDDMRETWNDFVSEMLSMLVFGWAFHEIVYKKRGGYTSPDDENSSKYSDGLLGWKSFALRPQDTLDKWVEDPTTGRIVAMQQKTLKGQIAEIPFSKGLMFRPSQWKNNPEGRSILRTAYRPWKFKKRFEELEGIGVERDLAGLPKIQPAEGVNLWDLTNPDMVNLKRQAEELVRNVRMDEQMGLVLPFGWTFELVSAGGARAHNVGDIIGRLNNMIAMTCMADFIILGHNNRYGSKALAGNKTAMFQSAINGFLDGTDEILNNFAVPRLYALNGWDPAMTCKFNHDDVNIPDVEVIGTYLKNLKAAGMTMFPDVELEKQALAFAGFVTDNIEFGKEPALDPALEGAVDDDGNPIDPSAEADDEESADSGGSKE
jgi:hypothetical protein